MMSIKYHDNTTPEQYGPDHKLLDNWDATAAYQENDYIKAYFRIEVPGWDYRIMGFSDDAERAAFYGLAHDALERCGFSEDKEDNYSRGTMVRSGKETLHIHPQEISGTVKKNNVRRIAEQLAGCEGLTMRWVDLYETVYDMTDAEYAAYLYGKRDDLRRKVLEDAKTKRSNLYKSMDQIIKRAADAIRIKRVGKDYYLPDRLTAEFVSGFVSGLVEHGYLVEATGRNGDDLIRTINKAEQKQRGLVVA